MYYVLTDSENNILKYPYTIGMLRKDNPNTSFHKQIADHVLESFNVHPVVEIKPEITSTQKLIKPDIPVYQDTQWQLIWLIENKTAEELETELNLAKANKLSELYRSCDADLKKLATGYPEREAQTWPVQLEEANRYLADNTSPTPFISAALKQGETVEQYANLIVNNNAAWSDYAGKVVLKRRTFEHRINTATTVQELDQIVSEIND